MKRRNRRKTDVPHCGDWRCFFSSRRHRDNFERCREEDYEKKKQRDGDFFLEMAKRNGQNMRKTEKLSKALLCLG